MHQSNYREREKLPVDLIDSFESSAIVYDCGFYFLLLCTETKAGIDDVGTSHK